MSIARVLELEREIARLQAAQLDALVAVASAAPVVEEFTVADRVSDSEWVIRVEDAVREEVAAVLRWSPQAAYRRIATARLLAGPLQATGAALAAGEVTMAHVGVVCEAADRLPGRHAVDEDGIAQFADTCARLQRRVLTVARRGTVSATRAAARRVVLAIDAGGQARRREQARCARDVHVYDDVDGLSTLIARLATEDAHALMTVVDALAHEPDFPAACGASMGERRAQALTALVLESSQVTARVDVVVDLPTLLGLADHPAEIAGQPVHPDAVRDLIAHPALGVTLRRLVTDSVTGHLLDAGRRSYAVPAALREFITTRDRTCRFPGCARRAERCQLDHATPWDDGGATSPANLGALCVRHHQLKTHTGWDITHSHDDGSCSWRSPAGRTHKKPANAILTPATPKPDPEPPPF